VKAVVKHSGFRRCTIGEEDYAYDPKTKTLYDINAYMNGKLSKVGHFIEKNKMLEFRSYP
jgi:hypothetical protein